jgi:hypothetical protein
MPWAAKEGEVKRESKPNSNAQPRICSITLL